MPKAPKHRLTCKPCAGRFGALEAQGHEKISLLHEELEALYLADYKGLYHEECAKHLGVSRPTFAKLLKGGRKKCVQMLLFKKALHVNERATHLVYAVPTDDKQTLSLHFNVARYFALLFVESDVIARTVFLPNPLVTKIEAKGIVVQSDEDSMGFGAGRVIPELLKEATHVVCASVGEGMVRNLEGMGIRVEKINPTEHPLPLEKAIKQ
ncbi:DUF134 domain-containing protein [Sulfurospirillum sp. T05]|uniref:DUF134 domain-containing protein n=1 Tax=Sulfurospirillum tamanense TaxID=2813362 RepID=A0ABS2WQ78_9BACT|nr:DUF134 domain-containing protein [Sulfurospirillum tamanensis]MBN2963824.1 DUF134 domain-containing protein [Sulfurospirillum tamanensis]